MKRKRRKQVRTRCLAAVMAAVLSVATLWGEGPLRIQAASQNDAVSWANAQVNKGLDYDGVYGNQCVDLIKYYYAYFGVAGYAMGNANAYISNALPPGWTRVYGGYQPGDVAVWKVNHSCNTCSTGSLGHVGIIVAMDGAGFYAVNQNFNSKSYCTKNRFNTSALACAIRPSYTSAPQPEASVSFADFSQNAVWDTNAEMYTKIMNPGRAVVSTVGCYLYDSNGTLLKSYSEQCGLSTSYVNYNCNINNDMKYTLQPGTTYKFVLYGVVNGKEYRDIMRSFTTIERENPVISDVSVVEENETGYTVRCKASDNVGVERVQFPTWTVANGQDDIQPDWGNNRAASGTLGADGYYTYRVNISDHNNELGDYITHIYAFDKAGNSACFGVSATVKRPVIEPTAKPTAEPTERPTTVEPTAKPTAEPTERPTIVEPTAKPTERPTIVLPTARPTLRPAASATEEPEQDEVSDSYDQQEETERDADEERTEESKKSPANVKKPGRVKQVKAKNLKGRAVKVTWKSAGKNCTYQIQIARNRAFTKEKLNDTTPNKYMRYYNATKKKTYYVRVRACRKSSGKKLYGRWSKVKKVKIKK